MQEVKVRHSNSALCDTQLVQALTKLTLFSCNLEQKSCPLDEIISLFFLMLLGVSESYHIFLFPSNCFSKLLTSSFSQMQLTHTITLIQEGFAGFVQHSHSLNDKVEATEAHAKVAEELLKVAKERELKHQEELSSSHNIIWELEAWVVKKRRLLPRRGLTPLSWREDMAMLRLFFKLPRREWPPFSPLLRMLLLR